MGNGAISCCEASSSMLDEITMLSPRGLKTPTKISIFNEVSRTKTVDLEMQELTKRVQRLKNIESGPVLQIKVVNSGPIPKETRYFITHLGLENSKRSLKDGKVYFGSKRKERGITVNDVVIPLHSKESIEQHRGRHFVITYNIDKELYYLKDLGKGFGVYTRLDKSLVINKQTIKENTIINIGSSFLAFSQVLYEKVPVLNIKVMGEERGSSCFEASESLDKTVTIGRGIACDVRLEDTLLSKVHATVYFNSNGWNLIDGDMQKPSTNGTWLYLSEDFQMYSSMIFKSNQSVFQVTSLTFN